MHRKEFFEYKKKPDLETSINPSKMLQQNAYTLNKW